MVRRPLIWRAFDSSDRVVRRFVALRLTMPRRSQVRRLRYGRPSFLRLWRLRVRDQDCFQNLLLTNCRAVNLRPIQSEVESFLSAAAG